MGLKITTNKKGEYKLISTISDERLHDKLWISENEAKKALIIKDFYKFVENTIKIYMDFPTGYQVDGLIKRGEHKGNTFLLNNDDDNIILKFNEICKELDIDIK